MSWPTSPTNGQTTTINGIIYVYNSAKNAWGPASTSVVTTITYSGNISAGNVAVTGNINGSVVASSIVTSGNITLTTSALSYAGNSVMPKTYTDAMAVVFGI